MFNASSHIIGSGLESRFVNSRFNQKVIYSIGKLSRSILVPLQLWEQNSNVQFVLFFSTRDFLTELLLFVYSQVRLYSNSPYYIQYTIITYIITINHFIKELKFFYCVNS